jgi:hypothetical protein
LRLGFSLATYAQIIGGGLKTKVAALAACRFDFPQQSTNRAKWAVLGIRILGDADEAAFAMNLKSGFTRGRRASGALQRYDSFSPHRSETRRAAYLY